MKILAIDTSSKICSVSILENTDVIKEKSSDDEKTHSQKLMPLIDELFKETNLTLDDIDLIACSQGPGSFTGIRIGISTAKAFSDAKDIKVVGVTALEGLAYNIKENGLIVSLIDAKNDNVYYSLFRHENGIYTQIGDYEASSIYSILDIISNYENLIFVGDGAKIHKDLIILKSKSARFANDTQDLQTSISIGLSGYYKYQNNEAGDSNILNPIYLKKSQAERALDGEK